MTVKLLSFILIVISIFALNIWGSVPSDQPDAYHNGVTQTSTHITMRDGVKIAVDIMLPKGLSKDAKLPTILDITRYWRNNSAGIPSLYFVSHGYAMVLVDVRGTGASTGVWSAPFSRDEIADNHDIVSWIVAQPWCSGNVGAIGTSYEGGAAQLLAASNHPAVKAVIPRFQEFDEYTDLPFPGGVFTDSFVKQWQDTIHQLDNSHDIKPVDEDKDYSLLKTAIKDHAQNVDVYKSALKITYRDDVLSGQTQTLDSIGVPAYQKEIEQSKAAIYGWGSWTDAATADAVIHRFLTFNNPQKAMIGAWNHGGSKNTSLYPSPFTPDAPQLAECLRYFDHYLKGKDNGVGSEHELVYYTMGEEKWKSTKVWPVAGTITQDWYFGEGQTLTQSSPKSSSGADTYKVDFDATTGKTNRWQTEMGGGAVVYPDRAAQDAKLLTYTSAPLAEDIEITGAPIVDLYVTSTHTDGAFFVYLEGVDENGKVTYLTEGQLRAIHRKISNDAPPYRMLTPYHSFKQKDGSPLVPGQVAELKFGLLTTSVLVKKAHRIRVAIAGADKDTFARVPADGTPQISVARNAQYASSIQIPIVPHSSSAQLSNPWRGAWNAIGLTEGNLQSRVDPPIETGPTPTVAQIIDRYVQALGGREAIAKNTTRFARGIRISPVGTDDLFEIYTKNPDQTYSVRKSAMGTTVAGSIGQDAWNKVNDEPVRVVSDRSPSKNNTPQHILQSALYIKEQYSGMKLKGTETIGGQNAYVIEATNSEGFPTKLCFDIRSGLMICNIQRQKVQSLSSGKDGWTAQKILADVETYYGDYRNVDGIMIPFMNNSKIQSNVTTTIYIEIKNNVPVDDSKFKMPK